MMTQNNKDLYMQTLGLVNKAKDGDSDAFSALYNLYIQRLCVAVRRNLGTQLKKKIEPEDLIQSVWKDCFANMDGFDYQGPDSFYKWLRRRLESKICDKFRYFKAKKRNVEKEQAIAFDSSTGGGAPMPQAVDPTPSVVAMTNENHQRLMDILDQLPDAQRQVVVFRIRDNMEFDEIAKKIQRSQGAARQLYNRALSHVNKIWDKV